MKSKLLGVAVMAAIMTVPAAGQDDAATKKRKNRRGQNNVAGQLLKQLEEVGLTDEQTAKVKEAGKSTAAKMKEMREAAGITTEMTRKRAQVQKKLRESDMKGKELVAAINKEAGYTEEQAEALKKVNAARIEFQKKVIGMLSDEQKAKLPQRMQRLAKADSDQPKKKRKKNAE